MKTLGSFVVRSFGVQFSMLGLHPFALLGLLVMNLFDFFEGVIH